MMMHKTACPLCGLFTIKNIMRCPSRVRPGESFPIDACGTCGFQFTNDCPDAESIQRYYETPAYGPHHHEATNIADRIAAWRRRWVVRWQARLIKKVCRSPGRRFIDIGCGKGNLVAHMRKCGWESVGIEPSAAARMHAKHVYGIDVQNTDILGTLPSGSFDAVMLWHVLEHMPDVQAACAQIQRLLAPDGVAIIAVPNHTCFDEWYYAEKWPGYDVPLHYAHFVRPTLERLLRMHSLRIVSVRIHPFCGIYLSMLSEAVFGGSTIRGAFIGCISDIIGRFHRPKASALVYVVMHDTIPGE